MLPKLTSNRQFQNSVVGNVGITVIEITSGESRVSRRYTLDRRNTQVRRRKKKCLQTQPAAAPHRACI